MTVTVTHATVATAADDPTAEINKAEWNADHVIVGGLQSVSVTLLAADILALHTTPVELVPAPSASQWICVSRVNQVYRHHTTQYVNGAAIGFGWDSGNLLGFLVGEDPTSPVVNFTENAVWSGFVRSDDTFANLGGKGVSVFAGSAITDGDGTLTVTVEYTVEDLPA